MTNEEIARGITNAWAERLFTSARGEAESAGLLDLILDALAAKDAETERLEAGHRNLERALANTVEIGVAKDAEIERLRAALQPFAGCNQVMLGHCEADDPVWPELPDGTTISHSLTVGSFQRAAKALSPPAPASAGEPGMANDRLITAKLADVPAPGCARCGGSRTVSAPCPDKVAHFGEYARPELSCLVEHRKPCPSCRPEGGKS